MTGSLRPLQLARAFPRRDGWHPPTEFGPDGWRIDRDDLAASVIATVSTMPGDDVEWVHASIARADIMPTYDDLQALHVGAFGDGYAYQLFVPRSSHVNIHEHALHLWGRLDGLPAMPDFGALLGAV